MPFTDAFSSAVFSALRELDATTDIADFKEDEMCDRLLDRLRQRGDVVGGSNRKCYPGSLNKTDLVWTWRTGEIVVGEAKCHWPSWWLKHHGNLSRFVNHMGTAARDLQKLASQSSAEASHVCLLFYGSHAVHGERHHYDLDAAYGGFASENRLDTVVWESRTDAWPNSHGWNGYRNLIRVWICRRDRVTEWPSSPTRSRNLAKGPRTASPQSGADAS